MADEEKKRKGNNGAIVFVDYKDESRLEDVDRLVASDLSEPYSIFTYRYFLNRFPDLCILAVDEATGEVCGCVVGKIDIEDSGVPPPEQPPPDAMMVETEPNQEQRGDGNHVSSEAGTSDINTGIIPEGVLQTGYIGMLAVSKSHRRKGIGKDLVRRVLQRMKDRGCESVTLETVSLFHWYCTVG